MPSWNIHTAHVERLLAEHGSASLGIADSNSFLYGNYVPDVYLGFMVHGTTYRLDYCLTHLANPSSIPVPDADRFWDECIWHRIRRAQAPAGESLAVGAWAHLAADRLYNGRFREFCQTHDVPAGDELRERKQADFKLFGNSLTVSMHVEVTPALLESAERFRPYSILEADVRRSVAVASAIVDEQKAEASADDYQLLGADWMSDAFEACHERVASWLVAWQQLRAAGAPCSAADIRAHLGLPPATPDDPAWLNF